MKKLCVLGILLLVMFTSLVSAHNPKKESKKVTALIKEVNFRLDSIVQNNPDEVIQGYKYYHIKEGAFTILRDTMIIGTFGLLDRIRFTSHHGNITFTGIDHKGKPFEKTLEQLLFALEEY